MKQNNDWFKVTRVSAKSELHDTRTERWCCFVILLHHMALALNHVKEKPSQRASSGNKTPH